MDAVGAGIIGGSISAALMMIKAMEIIWPGKKGDVVPGLVDCLNKQLNLLEKINDRQIGVTYELHHLAEMASKNEMSLQALHRRIDTTKS